MAKKQEKQKRHQLQSAEKELINPKYHSIVYAIIILFVLLFLFNRALIEGKIFISGDIIAFKSWDALIEDARSQKVPLLWNPYIFCGMPAYASLSVGPERPFDLLGVIRNFIFGVIFKLFPNRDVFEMVIYLFLMGIGFYILSIRLGINKFVAFVVSLSGVLSTFFIVWLTVGHHTKIITSAFLPYTFVLIDELSKRFKLLYFVLLVVVLWFIFAASHIQMMFYVYLAVGIYYLVFLIVKLLKRESIIGLIRSGLFFAVASLFAFGIFMDKYLSVLEYNHYSIRGQPPLLEKVNPQKSDVKKSAGLDYEYATQWSFSPGEILTFFIPSIYGFGWRNYSGELTGGEMVRLNTYFGPMPFTDAPNYLGLVVLIFAIIGIIYNFKRNHFVQFLTILSIIALLISFGKEFPVLYDFFFYYVPYFNRFRVPSMILILVMFSVPILTGFGLQTLINFYRNGPLEKVKKNFLNLTIAFGALFLFALIFRGILSDIFRIFADDKAVALVVRNNFGPLDQQLYNRVAPIIYDFLFENFLKDLRIALFLTMAIFALTYLLFAKKLTPNVFKFSIVLLLLFDLLRVDFSILHYSDRNELPSLYQPPDYVEYIKRDTTLFRVLELSGGQPVMSNHLALYRLQNVFGYHGAKIRAFQDLIDITGLIDPFVLSLLNVKYIITDREDSTLGNLVFNSQRKVLYNPNFLQRAFFVKRFEISDPFTILMRMKKNDFNPREVVFLEKDPSVKIDEPTEKAQIEFLSYGIQKVKLKAFATGNNLLFMSDSYYPKWKCYIDGKETEILRANYVFRAVVVPEGEHIVEFVYEDDKFEFGSKISLGLNIFLLVLLAIALIPEVRVKLQKTTKS